jgi:hypothetical protein
MDDRSDIRRPWRRGSIVRSVVCIMGVMGMTCATSTALAASSSQSAAGACSSPVLANMPICNDGIPLSPADNAALATWAGALQVAPVIPLPVNPPDPGVLPAIPTGVFRGIDATGAPVASGTFTNSLTAWTGVVPGAPANALMSVWAGADSSGNGMLVLANYDALTGTLQGVSTIDEPAAHGIFQIVTAAANVLLLRAADGTYWLAAPGLSTNLLGPVNPGTSLDQIIIGLETVLDVPVNILSSPSSAVLRLINELLGLLGPGISQPTLAPAVERSVVRSYDTARIDQPVASAAATGPVAGHYYYVNYPGTASSLHSAGQNFACGQHFAYINLHFGAMQAAGAGGGETRLNGAPPGTYSSFNRDETLTDDFLHGYTYGHAHCGNHKGAATVTMGVTNDGANSHALAPGVQ